MKLCNSPIQLKKLRQEKLTQKKLQNNSKSSRLHKQLSKMYRPNLLISAKKLKNKPKAGTFLLLKSQHQRNLLLTNSGKKDSALFATKNMRLQNLPFKRLKPYNLALLRLSRLLP